MRRSSLRKRAPFEVRALLYRRAMVSIGAPRPLTLGERIAARDASIKIRIGALALAGLRAKRALKTAGGAGVRFAVTLLSLLAVLISRHGLVLAGLTAFTAAAWIGAGMVAGLVVLGAALFFLEARRK